MNFKHLSKIFFLAFSLKFVSAFADNTKALQVSYVQLDAVGSLPFINKDAFNASNVLIFAFADINATQINDEVARRVSELAEKEPSSNVNLLSIGGASASRISLSQVPSIIFNISSQIKAYNKTVNHNFFKGVDLDLENGTSQEAITALASGFKQQGFLVSVAPQAINLKETNVDPKNPVNLGLSSGGNNNQYGEAISKGYADYIMLQTYNSTGWTVGNVDESRVEFISQIAEAMENSVKNSCSTSKSVCIPQATKIVLGTVSNAGASGSFGNIFGSNGIEYYKQKQTLQLLSDEIKTIYNSYPHIAGIMQWSLNNDYYPSGWGDNHAIPGLFSSMIFGAPLPSPLPYFYLGVDNLSSAKAVSVSMVIKDSWYVFGAVADNGNMSVLNPGKHQYWGTMPSSQNPETPYIVDSSSLDSLFLNQSSFKANKIVLNIYNPGNLNLANPNSQVICSSNYVFSANKGYHVMLNADYSNCEIQELN